MRSNEQTPSQACDDVRVSPNSRFILAMYFLRAAINLVARSRDMSWKGHYYYVKRFYGVDLFDDTSRVI